MQDMNEEVITIDKLHVIKHGSPVPYYYQLVQYITEQIRSKQWLPGQMLPSEQELCTQLDISRTVVRQAMNHLANEGLIVKQNGKRSSIAKPKYSGDLMQNLHGMYEDAAAKGQTLTTKVLDLKVTEASADVAQALHLTEREPVILLNRLRTLDGVPTVLVVTYIPEHLCPTLLHENLENQSLYELLAKKYNLVIAEGLRTIEAVNATHAQSELLDIPSGSSLLLLKSISFLSDGVPLEYFVAYHRGDRSKFQVHIRRT